MTTSENNSKLSKTMMYVESRLNEWAEWYSKRNDSGLGYPACSLEYRLMTEGAIPKSGGPKPLPNNQNAEEIEFLVNEMFTQNNKMALALRTHYFGKRRSRDRSIELDVSATRFRVYVDMARQWLAGRLSASNSRY